MICVSGYTAADVVRRYDVDEARVRVIPNAPSLPIGNEPVPDDGPYLLAVGDLRPKKNLLRLVEAFARCARRAWRTGSCWRGSTAAPRPSACARRPAASPCG